MFIYMSKKIAIPKHTGVSCIAWNHSSGFIAVGGDDGMLKVLKLESGGGGNLSMNLSLEGHSGQLQVATWNEIYQKLTTSDEHGVIIVWMLYKGSWYEEMINNRNKSTVRGMAWSSDGQKVCIAYEDGAVIVGSVDGSRVWGKDIKGPGLSAVQWSPDNSMLLFALSSGELHLYDNQGNYTMPVNVQCCTLPMQVTSLDWYYGPVPFDRPILAICYKNGRIQLMKGYIDDGVIIIDSGLEAVGCRWNHNGSVLAVAGTAQDDSNAVQFFNSYGEHIRTLRVPGGTMRSISWEGRSLRIAIAVDSFIYFANVKPDHKRAFYGNTLAFCSGPETVTFWDISTNQTWVNHIPGVVDMCGVDEYCVIATHNSLVVSNQQGIQCDAKITLIDNICYVASNSKGTVIAASKDYFMVWKFATPTRQATAEQIFHADGSPFSNDGAIAKDPICALSCSDTQLLVAKESGQVLSFSVLNVNKLAKYNINTKPYKIALNSNSSKFYVIDVTGSFYILDMEMSGALVGPALRRDVWGAQWATDNPQLVAVAEKARLYILRGTEPEEPLVAQGYLCKFQDLEIISILLDDISDRCSSEHIVRVEVKSLRDTRQLLDKVGLKEAETFIQDNPHPKLWKLLAEAALRKCDSEKSLEAAEAAYVRRADYAGVRFVRRLVALHAPSLRRAQIHAYFKEFDAAEKIYLDEDRRDLAIALRQRLGHWFRVVELLKMSANTSEAQMMEAHNSIGDYYIDRQNWISAIEYYKMTNNTEGLIKCYTALEDNDALSDLFKTTPGKQNSKNISMVKQLTQEMSSLDLGALQNVSLGMVGGVGGVAVLREVGRLQSAAHLCAQLAKMEAGKKNSPLRIKKLYVLAGHLYAQSSVDGCNNRDAIRCFRIALAQHWFSVATTRALSRPQRTEAAVRAAARLEQHLNQLEDSQLIQAWSTIAMISAEARCFAICSRAFVKLEALEDGDTFANLAVDLFTKHIPKNPKGHRFTCPLCQTAIPDWTSSCPGCEAEFPCCSVSGRALSDPNTVWSCKLCRHTAAHHELVLRHSCPVCHSALS